MTARLTPALALVAVVALAVAACSSGDGASPGIPTGVEDADGTSTGGGGEPDALGEDAEGTPDADTGLDSDSGDLATDATAALEDGTEAPSDASDNTQDAVATDAPLVEDPDTTGATDTTEPDSGPPDTTEPDTTEPDTTEPDTTEPDMTEPDTTEPDATEPDTTEPDATEPDVTEPDVTEPDVTEPPTVVDEVIPISADTGYAKGELYGIALEPSGRVNLFWRGNVEGGGQDLLLSRSDASVSAFEPPLTVKAGVDIQEIMAGGDVAFLDDIHLLTWRDKASASSNLQIRLRRAALPDLAGTDHVLATAASGLWRPHLAVQEPAKVCVIWQGSNKAKCVCSADGGVTFGDTVTVSPSGVTAQLSDAVFLVSGTLVVAYQANPPGVAPPQIGVRTSDDLGQTWSDEVVVSADAGSGSHLNPSIAVGTDAIIHLAWYTSLPSNQSVAWHTTSVDGLTWSEPVMLPTLQSVVRLRPGRAADLHAIGEDAAFGYGDPHWMTSFDSGQTWSDAKPVPVTEDYLLLGHDLAANFEEGWVHIAWWEAAKQGALDHDLLVLTVDP